MSYSRFSSSQELYNTIRHQSANFSSKVARWHSSNGPNDGSCTAVGISNAPNDKTFVQGSVANYKTISVAAVKMLIKAVKSAIEPAEFTKHFLGETSAQFSIKSVNLMWSFYLAGIANVSVPVTVAITAPNVGLLKRAKNFKIYVNDKLSGTIQIDELSMYSMPGFYYTAGYYEKSGSTAKLVNDKSKYIGINNHSTAMYWDYKESNIVSDINTLPSYDYYFQLYNANADSNNNLPYYTQVNKIGIPSTPSGGGDSSGQVSVKLPTFNPIILDQVDYSTAAETDILKYIYNFDEYEVKFIPVNNGQVNINNSASIKHIATFEIETEESGISVSSPRIRIDTTTITEQELFEILDENRDQLSVKCFIQLKESNDSNQSITFQEYFSNPDNFGKYKFIYKSQDGTTLNIDFNEFINRINKDLKYLNEEGYNFNVELSLNQEAGVLNLHSLEIFEAFTRGRDFIEENYTIVRPKERNPKEPDKETSRCMNYDENYFTYKYSGRDIDLFVHRNKNNLCVLPQKYNTLEPVQDVYCALIHDADLLLENDVTLGETYGEQEYFIEAIKTPVWKDNDAQIKVPTGEYSYKDSFKLTKYLSDEGIDATLYTDNDLDVLTSKIDLLQCQYYYPTDATFENDWCDCRKVTNDGIAATECAYQKLGYCPYRFNSEKHPRRIRTLQQSKSNRFNLTQELCKVFEFYPYFYIEHDANGRVKLDKDGNMLKHIFFITEKGSEKYSGFRYEKNLSNITRTIDSSTITTKLYVESVDSQFNNDGLCSIQTAIDNIGQNSYILDFSYYTKIGALDADQVQRDLYGIDKDDFAFLPRIGEYNKLYDKYSNLIITMTSKTLTELMAEIIVDTTGVITALEQRKKIGQQMYQFKAAALAMNQNADTTVISYQTSDTYKNFLIKYREQATILWGLIEKLFYSQNYFSMPIKSNGIYSFIVVDFTKDFSDKMTYFTQAFNDNRQKYCRGELLWRLLIEGFENYDYVPPFDHWEDITEQIIEPKLYEINGKLGKYRSLYNEVQYWKRERAKILNKINDLSLQFYRMYEPYIKEGTFTDSNYLTDNEYYWAGVSVLNDSCEPKLTYNFNVVDISPLEEFADDYNYEIADTTYLEDIDFFGINKHTGFPNREKVMITETTDDLDQPSKNTVSIKNYSSAFSDLFGAITASVQSLTYNENVYKRASNFTAKQYITTESLQDTLDIGDLTLLDTAKSNIQLDESGTEGNDIDNTASQYKITGEGVLFSTDGGETWDVGVGPKGMNMDYAKFGSLDASKVQIIDGEYVYFLWDKDGINAYRDPSASVDGLADFARFNKYGLSLIENGNVRLRAGYEYRSNEYGSNFTGDYTKELELKDQNIGFYLYNDKGQPIFKTETQSDYNDETTDYSARLSLTGEMFVTNKILDSGSSSSGVDNNVMYKKQLSVEYTFRNDYKISVYEGADGSSMKETYDILQKFNNDFSLNNLVLLDKEGNLVNEDVTLNENYNMCVIRGVNTAANEILEVYPDAKLIDVYYYSCNFFVEDQDEDSDIISISLNDIKNNIEDFISESPVIISDQTIRMSKEYGKENSASYTVNNSNKLQILDSKSYYIINSINNEASIETENQVLQPQLIKYYEEQDDGSLEIKEISLYLYQNNGVLTYWKDYTNTSSPIGRFVDDFSLSEVGIFINNKKAIRVNSGELEDKTNSDSQKISSDTDQTLDAIHAILSGAERTFMITAGGTDSDGNFVYKNILSVLKNGSLYMGGVITDYYGKSLDISNLSYMPDEVRINQPSFILTNAGQMWCDWDKFFSITTDENGNWGLTSTSLKNALDEYNNALSAIATNINGYLSSFGGGNSGYYITDPIGD